MTSPVTPQPNRPQESVAATESTSTQLFSVLYIMLTGLVDSMVPANSPWALLRKSFSYIVKLAPILWWALPFRPAGCPSTSSPEPAAGWIPDTTALCHQSDHYVSRVLHVWLNPRPSVTATGPDTSVSEVLTTQWYQSLQEKLPHQSQSFFLASVRVTHHKFYCFSLHSASTLHTLTT
ncbi:hypothetical protein DSO57_1003743 [Entomophthora muscae]|uniref:Uncharacterized protein n=1 Tax=Entomophthora muscae TaxID=34485 RepID=A0ACC2SXZ6_9FUNG|nr:hypothetical protein DSO57_1003743 [Entomophthora muscae]